MKIFVSYSRLDSAIQNDRSEAFLDLVVLTLERLKHTVWLDKDLSGGQAWWSKILDEIRGCDVVVFLMTPLSTSHWSACLTELEYARKLEKPILPIQLLEVSGTIPEWLATIQYVDLSRSGWTIALVNALADAKKELVPPIVPSVSPPEQPAVPTVSPPEQARPEQPISLVRKLEIELRSTKQLDVQEQYRLVEAIEGILADPLAPYGAAARLLRMFRNRPDVLFTTASKVDQLAERASRTVLRDWKADDDTPLHVEKWTPTKTSFVVCVVHDYGEHIGRYEHLAEALGAAGGLVFGADLRGQGWSGGLHGDIADFSRYVDDTERILQCMLNDVSAEERPGAVPWFLLGHSTGGLIVLELLSRRREGACPIQGAIISSLALRLSLPVALFKPALAPIFAYFNHKFLVTSDIAIDRRSSDPDFIKRYENDPRSQQMASAHLYMAFKRATGRAAGHLAKISVPMLWCLGTGDRVVDPRSITKLFAQAQAKDHRHRLVRFEGFNHDLHNEPSERRDRYFEEIEGWIRQTGSLEAWRGGKPAEPIAPRRPVVASGADTFAGGSGGDLAFADLSRSSAPARDA